MIGFKRILSLAAVTLALACSGNEVVSTDPAAPETTASFSTTTGDSLPAGPLVWTGKDDYVPDEIVDMFGSGWTPGETVVLTLAEQPQVHTNRTFQVIADTLGAFEFEGFRPEAHHAGVTFLLTASGTISGFLAQTTFTDGIATSSVSSNSNSSGTSASQRLTINVGAIAAGQVAIAQIVVNKDLGSGMICPPAGWTSILRTNRGSGVYVQETFVRTTAAAAGSHEWTFRASCPSGSLVGGKGASGGVIVYDGVDASNPIRDSLGANGSSSGTPSAPSASAVAGDMVIRFFGVEKNTTVTSNPVGTDTSYVRRSSSPVERSAAAFDIPHTSGATTGPFNVSFGSSAEWTAQTIVLRMAVVNYTLTVTKAGTGSGTVTSVPAGINCGADCSEDYVSGTSVKLMAAAAPGSTFTGWSGAGTTDVDGNRVVSMTEARNVTATFTLNTYALTVTLAGNGTGTVTSSPTGINCGADCSENYNHDTDVTLTGTPGAGSGAVAWSGGSGTTNPDGTYTVSMTQARNVTATFTLTDQQGPITSNVVANPVPLNTAGTVTANVSDVTTGGSNIASAQYSIDGGSWQPMAAQDGAFNSPNENVTAALPSSATTGVFEVCVKGKDAAGNTGNTECALYAVYDPSAGFVTGGGWFDSPVNACKLASCAEDGSTVGKANFGFVSKYKKGATAPVGNTEFQFKAGDLNFNSSIYEWLVVSGARAQYKGTGTINGAGNYGFLLTAIDGQIGGGGGSDKFRIKIWDKNNGDAIVYDNQMGALDGSNPTTGIGGGSIMIHAK